jgi:hypothetical protein
MGKRHREGLSCSLLLRSSSRRDRTTQRVSARWANTSPAKQFWGSVLIWIVSSPKRKLICLPVSLMRCGRRCIGIGFTCARSQHRPYRERKNKNDRLFHIKNYSAQEDRQITNFRRIDYFWFPDLLEAATEKHHTNGFENQRDQQNQNKFRHKS